MTLPRYAQAAELARITSYACLTGWRALCTLIADGTLTAGPSLNARARAATTADPAPPQPPWTTRTRPC
jgi:hypothetical protein